MPNKLSRTGKTFCFVPYATNIFYHNTNEQLINEILYRGKISFKMPIVPSEIPNVTHRTST